MRTYEKQVLINVTGGISRGGTGKRVPKISGRAIMQKPPPYFSDTQMPGKATTSTDRAIDTRHPTAAIGESKKRRIDGVVGIRPTKWLFRH